MGRNTLKYVVAFFAAFEAVQLLGRSPWSFSFVMLGVNIFLPVIAGVMCMISIRQGQGRGRSMAMGLGASVLAGLVYMSITYYLTLLVQAVHSSGGEITVWLINIFYDVILILAAGLLFVLAVKAVFYKERVFPVKRTAVIFCVAALAAAMASWLTGVCITRVEPSEIVGDFGMKYGTDFMWILNFVEAALVPAFFATLCINADKYRGSDTP